MTKVTADMTIGHIISLKGEKAGEIIDKALCDHVHEKLCCPGVTHHLGFATRMKGKSKEVLNKMVDDLNAI